VKVCPVRRFVAATTTLLAVCLFSPHFTKLAYAAEQVSADFPKVFHLVGVPKVRRDERVDVSLAGDGLVFLHKKVPYQIPYTRVRRVTFLRGDRVYEKATYAAAVAFGLPGAFMIMKKHHVDTIVLDYDNERGGQMGIVVQLETGQGALLKSRLVEKGVNVTEPPGADTPPRPGVDTTKKEKQ
jgi:hypothetical protein